MTTYLEMRMKKLIEQILKFGVVGITATVIDFGVLYVLSQPLGMDPVISAGISFCVSLVFNYVASMRYVFTHREDMSRSREFVIFLVLSLIGLAINEAIMAAGVAVLGISALAVMGTKVLATAIVMVWNFVSRKKWLDAGDAQ
ncbi:GtrA family protein [uncultured Parolsenella sp.]|uniref:GtrA family protein n=1 Tax=uncultured Parolsenella sp. TaxID=2083008 RepID=UPI0027DB82AA|nr:GtrA family protein [uncultured Parolsenella sp.]